MADRRLAGAEALDLGLGLHFGELGRELGREIAGRQHDLDIPASTPPMRSASLALSIAFYNFKAAGARTGGYFV